MSFFETKYSVTGHHGEIYRMTAKQLCERVIEDSKSDYNWIAPARELVKVCKKIDFPEEYALTIKIAILNCFANIEHWANCGGEHYIDNQEDKKAVQYCYNSLYGIDTEEASLARKRYLTEMINSVIEVRVFDPLYHPGSTFRKLREDLGSSKFEEYISKKNIDFDKLVEILKSDFAEIVKAAETNGDFVEDEKKERESRKIFFQRLNDL